MRNLADPGSAPAIFGSGRPRVGVVLAAGRAERLHPITGGRSKVLLRLGGVSLLERSVRTLLASGMERVVVVAGFEGRSVGNAVERLSDPRVELVIGKGWEAGNGASLATAAAPLEGEENFVLLCADHLFAAGALDALLLIGGPAVLVDESPTPEAWGEGTRVRIQAGMAAAFRKSLPEPAIDCGAFVLTSEIFACQRRAAADGDHSLAGAVSRLAEVRAIRAVPLPQDAWWQDVDAPADLRRAGWFLRRSLAKESDGPVSHFLNRPISTRLSFALAPFRIPPTVLSLVALFVGMLAAGFLAAERGVVGGLLVQASSVIDGMDGETARLQFRTSVRGARLDDILDRMVDAAVVAGMGLWAIEDSFRFSIAALIAAIACAWAVFHWIVSRKTVALALQPRAEKSLGFLLGSRDARLLLVTVGALVGRPLLGVLAMATSYVISVAVRAFLVRRTLEPLALPAR
jgi:1L-myo-inositol 1-phosphate cytidylyltransferase / CDP-L-myo-inositol myo-inositolphosphotransferase